MRKKPPASKKKVSKKPKIDPKSIKVGDMIKLPGGSRWTLNIRGDYSKNSRELRFDGGWFLVVEREEFDYSQDKSILAKVWPGWNIKLELYNPEESFWQTEIWQFSSKRRILSKNSLEILGCIPST